MAAATVSTAHLWVGFFLHAMTDLLLVFLVVGIAVLLSYIFAKLITRWDN